jgi:hypothetical protein
VKSCPDGALVEGKVSDIDNYNLLTILPAIAGCGIGLPLAVGSGAQKDVARDTDECTPEEASLVGFAWRRIRKAYFVQDPAARAQAPAQHAWVIPRSPDFSRAPCGKVNGPAGKDD